MSLEKSLIDYFGLVSATFFGLVGVGSIYRARLKNFRAQSILNKTLKSGATLPATLHPIIHTEKCIGCTSCVSACPEQGVLAMIDGKATLVGPGKCVGHGECKVVCPENAIDLVFGTTTVPYEIPELDGHYQSKVPGLYIAGELGGMGLIRNATKQGVMAVEAVAKSLENVNTPIETEVFDLIVVGAGPAGMAAALCAKQRGLKFLVLEQDQLGGAIAHYPRNKLVMSSQLHLPLVGVVKFKKNYVLKEELLALWHQWHKKYALPLALGEKLVSTTRLKPTGLFQVESSKRQYMARRVVLCLGVGGSPRKLGVTGEEESHYVYYRLGNAQDFKRSRVVVIGGGNSAAECALTLADQTLENKVTLVVRGKTMDRANEDNISVVEKFCAQGKMDIFYETEVKKINQNAIVLERTNQSQEIHADAIFALIGQERPYALLKSWGIQTRQYFAQMVGMWVLIFLGWGCQPERPAAEELISPISTFSHEGLTSSCLECHEKDRPELNHYTDMDCVSCHTVNNWKEQAHYSHVPAPQSCQQCHQVDRPTEDHGQKMDCINCHDTGAWAKQIMFHHKPNPQSCKQCHEQKRPSLDHGQKLDCAQCHLPTKWGRDHFYSHDPSPRQCLICHDNKRPLKTLFPKPVKAYKQGHFEDKDCLECHKSVVEDHKWSFEHADAKNRDVKYCLPCHLERGKDKHFYGGALGWFKAEGKCYECHSTRYSWEETKKKNVEIEGRK